MVLDEQEHNPLGDGDNQLAYISASSDNIQKYISIYTIKYGGFYIHIDKNKKCFLIVVDSHWCCVGNKNQIYSEKGTI